MSKRKREGETCYLLVYSVKACNKPRLGLVEARRQELHQGRPVDFIVLTMFAQSHFDMVLHSL